MQYTVGCDADGRLTAVKARMLGDTGAYASVGVEGAGARRRTRLRPLQGAPHVDVVSRRRLHQQPAVRRDARLRRQPGALRHRGLHGPAGREGRPRRLGDPLAQRARGRRHVLHRPGAREVGRDQEDARGGEGAVLRGARRRAARSASPAASRTAASATGPRSGARRGSWWRPTARSRSTTATPRWVRGC